MTAALELAATGTGCMTRSGTGTCMTRSGTFCKKCTCYYERNGSSLLLFFQSRLHRNRIGSLIPLISSSFF